MAAPTLVFVERNGASTGTPTVMGAANATIFSSQDAPSTAALATTQPVGSNTYSFEKYTQMQVTLASTNAITGFSVYFSSTVPLDGGGLNTTMIVKFACTPTYAQPVNTASIVATTLCSTVTTAPGTTFAAPTNTVNAYSGYFVQQLQITLLAIGGNSVWPAVWSTSSYSYS